MIIPKATKQKRKNFPIYMLYKIDNIYLYQYGDSTKSII